jgi:flagellar biosynthesis/type III secretory pathway protein FliH
MKTWNVYLMDARLNSFEASHPRPERKYQYWAYKNGQAMGPYNTREEAKEKSTLVDASYCAVNDKIYFEWADKRAKLEQKALDAWHKDLRSEHSDLSDAVFAIAYSEAYERGHSSGYDEVASYTHDVCDLFRRVIQEVKNDLTKA